MEIRHLTCGLILAASASTAVADTNMSSFYAGTGAGMYYVDFDDIDFDETAPVVRAFGGYDLNEYISFEAGFSKFFEASNDVAGVDVELDGTAWDVSARPTWPINDQFKAYGIVGWTLYDFEASVEGGGFEVTEDDSENDLLYGLGGAFKVNDTWMVRGEWVAINVDDASYGTFSLSATYNFR